MSELSNSVEVDGGHRVNEVDGLVDKIWQDLDGRVSRERIKQVMDEVVTRFDDATVTTFLPILIERETREQLAAQTNPE